MKKFLYILIVFVIIKAQILFSYDINQDGHEDIIMANYNSYASIYWGGLDGYGEWTYTGTTNFQETEPRNSNVSDINGDGVYDVLISGHNKATIYWGSLEETTWSYSSSTLLRYGTWGSSVADLNTDGVADIILSGQSPAESTIVFGQKNGTEWSISSSTTLQTDFSAGNYVTDLNQDGVYDIVFANYYGSNAIIEWGAISAGTWIASSSTIIAKKNLSVQVADFNMDGILDVFSGYLHTGRIDNGVWSVNSSLYISTGQSGVIEDLNGDGILDILTPSSLFWGEIDDGEWVTNSSLNTGAVNPKGCAIADVDGDGILDLVIGEQATGGNSRVYWGELNGNNWSISRTSFLNTYYAFGVTAGEQSTFGNSLPFSGKPVPEPASIILMGFSIFTLMLHRIKK